MPHFDQKRALLYCLLPDLCGKRRNSYNIATLCQTRRNSENAPVFTGCQAFMPQKSAIIPGLRRFTRRRTFTNCGALAGKTAHFSQITVRIREKKSRCTSEKDGAAPAKNTAHFWDCAANHIDTIAARPSKHTLGEEQRTLITPHFNYA